MKKILFIAGMMLATLGAQAQLRIHNNGRTAINTTETPVSNFAVGYAGNSQFNNSMTGNNGGLYVRRIGSPTITFNWWKAIEGNTVPVDGNFNIGVSGKVFPSTPSGSGRAYGIWGQAGNTSSGYNYGVFGTILGSQNGAGIYGTAEADNGVPLGGKYAGYFNGSVYVTRYIYGNLLSPSAATNNASSNQTVTYDIDEESATEKLSKLSTIRFNMNHPTATASILAEGDTMETATLSTTEIQALQRNHYGLVAAQLQQVYPELVYEGQNGELCINYIEMIPLLVQSINELNARLNAQEDNGGVVMMSRAARAATGIEESTAMTIPMLKQNNPNPFTENTAIDYTLPETVQTANIYIYDMNGTQIQQIPLTERGESSVTVSGGMLSAGMYLYSLIADGKVIDTKRMILTK